MADQKITDLPVKAVAALQSSDYLLGIDAAEGYQMLITTLAQYILDRVALTHEAAGAADSVLDKLASFAASISSINSSLAQITPVTQITPTAGTGFTIQRSNVHKFGKLVIVDVSVKADSSFAGNTNVLTGMPVPAAQTGISVTGADQNAYIGIVLTSGNARVGGSPNATYSAGTYVFIGAYKTS